MRGGDDGGDVPGDGDGGAGHGRSKQTQTGHGKSAFHSRAFRHA